jgi:hypothetical protein
MIPAVSVIHVAPDLIAVPIALVVVIALADNILAGAVLEADANEQIATKLI